MAKRLNGHHLSGHDSAKGDHKIVVGKSASKGREVWRIANSGHFVTLTTSGSSVRAMDEAVTKYNRALKRLADR